MKWLKRIGIGLLALILVLLIVAWILPRELNVEAKGKMDVPANYVYNVINDYKNVSKWDPWVAQDETMTFEYGDKTSGVGAWYSWDSENMSSGKVTTKSTSPEKIEATIESPMMGLCDVVYGFNDKGNDKSEMTWNFKSTNSWPMNIMNFMIKSGVKKEFKKGFVNINNIAKKRFNESTYDGYKVNAVNLDEKNYVIQRGEVSMDNIMQFYGKNQGVIFQKIQKAGVEMEGNASMLVYAHNESTNIFDAAVAIPIKENVDIADASTQMLPAGKALVVDYYGDSANTPLAHMAIDDYLRDRGLFHNYPVVEEYVTDASTEKDPEKWLTKIIYYLSE